LADLGYDCRWYGLRAADVGAAHGRFRVFLFAVPADSDDQGLQGLAGQARTASTGRHGHPVAGVGGSALTLLPTPKASNNENRSSGWANGPNLGEALALLPTPQTSDTNGPGEHGTGGPDLRTAVSLLPTPRATDGTKGGPNQRGSSGDLMLPSAVTLLPTPTTQPSTGNGHARNLGKEARLLPTPSVADGMGGHLTRSGDRSNELLLPGVAKAHQQAWGQYAAAIARAEQAIGRPAPPPTEIGPKGAPRLSPRFVEWLMCLPEGWVTDLTGLTRNDQLKMLGNGVVPAQCAAALRAFLWDAYGIGAAA
jgi:DNA (cytosine-5)-methyltransferase 1